MPNAANAAFQMESPWHQAVIRAVEENDLDTARKITDVAKRDLDQANRLGREYLEPCIDVQSQSARYGGEMPETDRARVRFYSRPCHRKFLSEKEGRPVYEPVGYVEIGSLGNDKQIV
ncbi:MAG: hypothetical protein O7I42_16160, partial [Alphaproteobacteria bacterium]|nr:hypothetical protein [Alphaproteobacteria bacterium]